MNKLLTRLLTRLALVLCMQLIANPSFPFSPSNSFNQQESNFATTTYNNGIGLVENAMAITIDESPGYSGGGLIMTLPNVTVNQNDMICLPLTVNGFDNILGMQFSVNYDAAVLNYTGAQNFNASLLGFNAGSVGNPSPGNLTFTWNDP